MKAVVMAGGEGSRLRPITANHPKPLAPVVNRPIMEHILLLLKDHGIEQVVATVYYLADAIEGYFGDGEAWGIPIHYSLEDTPLGTAGSVKQAEEHLHDGTFVLMSGDALTDIDLQPAIEFHQRNKAIATIVLARVPNPLEFGVVITREDGRITRFLEKPSWSEVFSDTVNTGIYILEPEIFQYMEAGKPYDFSQDLFPLLLREGKPLYGYVMSEYWSDIGSLQQYREAHYDLLNRKVRLPLPGEESIPGVWVGAGTTIDPEAQVIPPVCFGRNCRIKRGAVVGPYTTLGDKLHHRAERDGRALDPVGQRLCGRGQPTAGRDCRHGRHHQGECAGAGRRRDCRPLPHRERQHHPHTGQALARQVYRGRLHRDDEPDLGGAVARLAVPRFGRVGAVEHRDDP
jgi:mannose-1-phosphate guanylyltransferase/phosphomannomutase